MAAAPPSSTSAPSHTPCNVDCEPAICEAIRQASTDANEQALLLETLSAHGLRLVINCKMLFAKEGTALQHKRALKYTQYLLNKTNPKWLAC